MEIGLNNSITFASAISRGRPQNITRYIRTFDGSTTYATLNDPIAFTGSFSISLEFAIPTLPVANMHIIDAPSATDRVLTYLNATTGAVRYDGTIITSAVLNGTPVADNAGIPSTTTINTLTLAGSGTAPWGFVGSNFLTGSLFAGEILSVRFTGTTAGGEIDENYVLDNNSLTTQYAVGESSPSIKYITYTNFIASDVELYTYNSATGCWEAAIHTDICYP